MLVCLYRILAATKESPTPAATTNPRTNTATAVCKPASTANPEDPYWYKLTFSNTLTGIFVKYLRGLKEVSRCDIV